MSTSSDDNPHPFRGRGVFGSLTSWLKKPQIGLSADCILSLGWTGSIQKTLDPGKHSAGLQRLDPTIWAKAIAETTHQ
ncbi:MAG: hypothetical protein AAFV80_05315 [Bacteroidota bacterium]